MSAVFDIGNAKLNKFVGELIPAKENDLVFEIGFGTGKLINRLARQIEHGLIEGVDFSESMVAIAEKRNRIHIENGKVRLLLGDFNHLQLETEHYDTVCTVNTIYFWSAPNITARKIADILKPNGKFVVGFEDIEQLKQRKLDDDIFNLYSTSAVETLLLNAGFSNGIDIHNRKFGSSMFNCVVATK